MSLKSLKNLISFICFLNASVGIKKTFPSLFVPVLRLNQRKERYKLSITVEVRKGNVEQAMRVLKRKVQKEGIVKELR